MLNVKYILILRDCYPERGSSLGSWVTPPCPCPVWLRLIPCRSCLQSTWMLLGLPRKLRPPLRVLERYLLLFKAGGVRWVLSNFGRFRYSIVFNEGRHLFEGIAGSTLSQLWRAFRISQSEPVLGTLGRGGLCLAGVAVSRFQSRVCYTHPPSHTFPTQA